MQIALKTTNNFVFIIDEKDYDRVMEKRWCYDRGQRTLYSVESDKKGVVCLNKWLTGNNRTRHFNNNPLDFRRENLL